MKAPHIYFELFMMGDVLWNLFNSSVLFSVNFIFSHYVEHLFLSLRRDARKEILVDLFTNLFTNLRTFTKRQVS